MVFIQLLDYSKEANGIPGNDPIDGVSYVVTELLRALTPQEAGPIELPGSSLNADVVVSRSGECLR